MFCKYKEPLQPEPENKPAAAPRDTRFRVKDQGEDYLYYFRTPRYMIVRDELVWREKEHAGSNDKDAADKIAALLNGDGR